LAGGDPLQPSIEFGWQDFFERSNESLAWLDSKEPAIAFNFIRCLWRTAYDYYIVCENALGRNVWPEQDLNCFLLYFVVVLDVRM
jgi:hypothetical protein